MTPKPDQGKDAEELLKAANDAAGHARILYVTLMLFLLYCAITAVSVTDEQLFRDGPIAIPLLPEAKVPVSVFFLVAPILALLLHLDVLLHFHGLAEKVRSFDRSAKNQFSKNPERLRHRFAGFPFLAWLTAPTSLPRWVRWLYGVIVYATLVVAPLGVLLLMQVLFLKYQSVETTWVHRLVILGDCALVWKFWPRLTATKPQPLNWPRHPYLAAILRVVYPYKRVRCLSLAIAGASLSFVTVIGEPIDWIIWGPMREREIDLDLGPTNSYFPLPLDWRRLRLQERFLTANSLTPEKQNEARHPEENVFGPALKGIEGVNLRGRNLRFIDLTDGAVPKGDFRDADLSYARMSGADMKMARFNNSKIVGGDLKNSNGAGSVFHHANLLGANLSNANMMVSDFSKATLDLSDLSGVQFLGSDLSYTRARASRIIDSNLSLMELSGNFSNGKQKFDVPRMGETDLSFSLIVNSDFVVITTIYPYNSEIPPIDDHRTTLPLNTLEKPDSYLRFTYSLIRKLSTDNFSIFNGNKFISCYIVIFTERSPGKDYACGQNFSESANLSILNDGIVIFSENLDNISRSLERLSPYNALKIEALEKLKHYKVKKYSEYNFSCMGKYFECSDNTPTSKVPPNSSENPYMNIYWESLKKIEPENYFIMVEKFICSFSHADLPLSAVMRLKNTLTVWMGDKPVPQSPNGGDWPGFKAEALNTIERINSSDCQIKFGQKTDEFGLRQRLERFLNRP